MTQKKKISRNNDLNFPKYVEKYQPTNLICLENQRINTKKVILLHYKGKSCQKWGKPQIQGTTVRISLDFKQKLQKPEDYGMICREKHRKKSQPRFLYLVNVELLQK